MARRTVIVTPAMEAAALAELDWQQLDAMTDADISRQVDANPDAAPLLSEAETAHGLVLGVRRQLQVTQAEFARRFGIPLATLREWEQGRRQPDAAAWSYLRVIAQAPGVVASALANTAARTSPPTA